MTISQTSQSDVSISLMERVRYALSDVDKESQDELVRMLELAAVLKMEQAARDQSRQKTRGSAQ